MPRLATSRLLILVAPMFAGLSFAGPAAVTADDFDLEQLDGTWRPVSGVLGGQEFPPAALENTRLTIDGPRYLVEANGVVDSGELRYDVTQDPMHLDVIGIEGPNKGRTLVAIFKYEEDQLTICYNIGGDERPTEFATPANSQLLLFVYRREP